ncbi:RNA polymerase sigma factor [Bacteroides helcogenes]|uniref:RNA polymerase, sigma-24 subunit, ECF subfamily n=1 Tax=Bacteroides helcogenes (strain ATCC 35417 / DSM 20613 / JCM 6297 / CCUG 15421 / P 36-108) TaxID=693979 RepID=E6SW11_BACT6|nr:RNA polymerase sigma-70 factor [Bacteroides helcogenes]ADV42536.1 RNA polymerase, sigma-24 subunit, ECF subfamily [Bacteroides helcogenes P 36-108]MDY5237702.1 RNA polymerase sigma-70 factor [Bacteroides helcogenes]
MEKNVSITPEKLFLERLQQGDVEAFSCLFDQYHRLLYILAYRYLRSGREAEDAVQYTFMKIWEQRESLNFSNGTRSLLFTIMKNYVLNELRHQQVVQESHEDILHGVAGDDEGFLAALEQRETKEYLRRAIIALPLQKREICRLKIEAELSNQQIAEKMNISISTVKSHYMQAIKMLKKAMGKIL